MFTVFYYNIQLANFYNYPYQLTGRFTMLPQINTQTPETNWVPTIHGLLPSLSTSKYAIKEAINSTRTFNVKLRYTLPANCNVADANVKP